MIKYIFTCISFSVAVTAFSQTSGNAIFLKWKINPNEVLHYKTVMQEIDTANHKDFSMDGMMKAMGVDKDSTNTADGKKMFKELAKQAQHISYITYLKKNKKNVIGIEMYGKDTSVQDAVTDTSKMGVALKGMQAMMKKMASSIMLRGSIHEDGTIESFYTKNDQKNLVAMFFELPGRSVKVGDIWPLSINLIAMDQNFTCDSSYRKNKVTLTGIENKGGEHIATIKYDIVEYVEGAFTSPFDHSDIKTTMKMSFQAIAGFSLEKGRWLVYDGVMLVSTTGMMSSQSTQKLSLIAE